MRRAKRKHLLDSMSDKKYDNKQSNHPFTEIESAHLC